MTKVFSTIATLVTLFLTLPIWYYLLYKVLEAVHASELMWFLFWIYVPAQFFAHAVSRVVQSKTN